MGHDNLKKAMLSGKEFKARVKSVKMLQEVLNLAFLNRVPTATVFETALRKYGFLFFNKKGMTFKITKIENEETFNEWVVPVFDIKNDCWVK